MRLCNLASRTNTKQEIENFGSCPLLFNEQTITWSHNLTADDAVQFIQACDITICGINRLNNNIII